MECGWVGGVLFFSRMRKWQQEGVGHGVGIRAEGEAVMCSWGIARGLEQVGEGKRAWMAWVARMCGFPRFFGTARGRVA
jgi:hypothetical protein